jgi:hypothetical protein
MRKNLNDNSVTKNIVAMMTSSRTYSAGTSWSLVDSMGNRLVAGRSEVDLSVRTLATRVIPSSPG